MITGLQVRHLSFSYAGRKVVDDVTLDVCPGEIVGLLGPNGAGKTTVFKLILALETPETGQVTLDRPLDGLPLYQRARLGLGYLAQTPSVFRGLSVRDNLLVVLESLKVAGAKEKAAALLEQFSLQPVASQKGHTLSGGERRRLEFARALCSSPAFLLVDEPFAGVDPIQAEEIGAVMSRLAQDGIGILMTDHAVREALRICHRTLLLVDGRIVESSTAAELTQSDLARRLYLGTHF